MKNNMLKEFYYCMDCGKRFLLGSMGVGLEDNDIMFNNCIACNSKNVDFVDRDEKLDMVNAFRHSPNY